MENRVDVLGEGMVCLDDSGALSVPCLALAVVYCAYVLTFRYWARFKGRDLGWFLGKMWEGVNNSPECGVWFMYISCSTEGLTAHDG